MHWYDPYKSQLEMLYIEAKSIITTFPAPLNELGLLYADKFDPVNNSGHDYICTLLPFWLQEETGITDEQCRTLAHANIFLMLYFFIQDDVMDGTPSAKWKPQLAMGNLLYREGLRLLMTLFPSSSSFWVHYDRYLKEWADCVVNENSDNYFIANPIKTAGKASPLKLSVAAACSLGGRIDRIASLEQAIELVLMSLQMSDDWFDWREDFQDGSYNGLIAMLVAEREDTAPANEAIIPLPPITTHEIETEIYVNGCLNRFVAIVQKNNLLLHDMNLESPHLSSFHKHIVTSLEEIANRITMKRDLMLKGGLNYFFTMPQSIES